MEDKWKTLSREPKAPKGVLNDEFVWCFARKLDLSLLSTHYPFSMEFLRTHQDKVEWLFVLKNRQYPESFLREMAQNFDNPNLTQIGKAWDSLCRYQQLSESFISDYMSKLKRGDVIKYQNVSKEFLQNKGLHGWAKEDDDIEAAAVE